MELAYLVLKKMLESYEIDTVMDFLLELLASIYKNKIKISNKDLYKNFNKIMDFFKNIHKNQWLKIIINLTKYFLPLSSYEFITKIAFKHDETGDVIFMDDHITITKNNKQIYWIYQDEKLLDGQKYLYNGKILNESLQKEFDQVIHEIIRHNINK